MLISKELKKELRKNEAVILLDDGKDSEGIPRLVLRKVLDTWGKCDPFTGGVCFTPLSDGSDHIRYESVLGYNTGRRASVQALLLLKDSYTSSLRIKSQDWEPFLMAATKMLLAAKPLTNPRITVESLTVLRYWYCDNWVAHRHSFVRLDNTKRYAKRATGTSVTLYSYQTGQIVCIAPASGYCPP